MASPSTTDRTEVQEKRPVFGSRYLTDAQNVFQHNAWDNVVWDEEQEDEARETVRKQLEKKMCESEADVFDDNAGGFWNDFYDQHDNRFFKDRHWLFTEFPELSDLSLNATYTPGSRFNILEVGCGAGNTVFPLLQSNTDPNLFIYACDFSASAINIIKGSSCYDATRCEAFVHDISSSPSTTNSVPFTGGSLDIIILIFTLSAIHPKRLRDCVKRLSCYLKPGGLLLFRDYGRYDMAQLRFKPERCVSDNFYVRGDGTQCYFFTQDEVDEVLRSAGLEKEQNIVDRRLQVNRSRKLKMYRIWIQCKYRRGER